MLKVQGFVKCFVNMLSNFNDSSSGWPVKCSCLRQVFVGFWADNYHKVILISAHVRKYNFIVFNVLRLCEWGSFSIAIFNSTWHSAIVFTLKFYICLSIGRFVKRNACQKFAYYFVLSTLKNLSFLKPLVCFDLYWGFGWDVFLCKSNECYIYTDSYDFTMVVIGNVCIHVDLAGFLSSSYSFKSLSSSKHCLPTDSRYHLPLEWMSQFWVPPNRLH